MLIVQDDLFLMSDKFLQQKARMLVPNTFMECHLIKDKAKNYKLSAKDFEKFRNQKDVLAQDIGGEQRKNNSSAKSLFDTFDRHEVAR